jgi:hypothetical protein
MAIFTDVAEALVSRLFQITFYPSGRRTGRQADRKTGAI